MSRMVFLMLLFVIAARGVEAADPPQSTAVDYACSGIASLIDDSAALSLPVRVERAFSLTLHAADDAIRGGEAARATVLLRTFTFEVRGVTRAKRLRPESADVLIAKAEEVITALVPSR